MTTSTVSVRLLEVGDVIVLPVTGVRVTVKTIKPPVGYPGCLDFTINGRLYLSPNRSVEVVS